MLVPLTRKVFETLIPIAATGDQYRYYWGKFPDFLRRFLFSLGALIAVLLVRFLTGQTGFEIIFYLLGATTGLYWLWSPIYWASRRNLECRRYQFGGFWQGKVLDMFVTEELVGKEETVNKQGELVIIENRERRINLEVGDETGFTTQIQAPLRRDHRTIRPGDTAELLLFSNRPDLSRISKVSDIYFPDYNLWVADYPYLQREAFVDVSRRLNRRRGQYSS